MLNDVFEECVGKGLVALDIFEFERGGLWRTSSYNELGPMYFRRAYRMQYSTFKALADELCPYIIDASGQKGGPKRCVPNGPILPDVRLACAIRWFAGGSAYDLMMTYGIGHSDTIRSYWCVVDAINSHPKFKIEYPKNHDEQRQIASGFEKVSHAGFMCCAGAIDGILIRIYKPSKKDCMDIGCNDGKFMCSRKSKFGLNCQAVCDVRGRILDISIIYPGSTSDCLAFAGMLLFHQLENGLLAPGLCIFGDNASLNMPNMATPYAAATGGTKDAYNFYHSQLRIRIECAFGMLTHRWAILRRAIPVNIRVEKTIALHNYCINANNNDISTNTARDKWAFEINGAIPLVPVEDHGEGSASRLSDVVPEQLLHADDHFDDIGHAGHRSRQRYYRSVSNGVPLPREQLHYYIEAERYTRPSVQRL